MPTSPLSQKASLAACEKETTMVNNRLNPEMGVIFDEVQIEEVIAPRL
jgi:hypothetical protein